MIYLYSDLQFLSEMQDTHVLIEDFGGKHVSQRHASI